jgi:hypothetical protein
MNEDNLDQRLQHCEWFEGSVREDEEFAGKVIWSEEVQFRMNVTVNSHNCVYWAPVNKHVHMGREMNQPGVNTQCLFKCLNSEITSRQILPPLLQFLCQIFKLAVMLF